MPKLTGAQLTTLVGAVLAVGVAVMDATLMHQALGVEVEKGLIYVGIGALLGLTPPIIRAS